MGDQTNYYSRIFLDFKMLLDGSRSIVLEVMYQVYIYTLSGVERVCAQRRVRDGQGVLLLVVGRLLFDLDPRQKTARRRPARPAAAGTAAAAAAAAAAAPPPPSPAALRGRRRAARRRAERGRRRDRLPAADPGAVGHGGRHNRARRADDQEHHAADEVTS